MIDTLEKKRYLSKKKITVEESKNADVMAFHDTLLRQEVAFFC